jgi:hypothetical protein
MTRTIVVLCALTVGAMGCTTSLPQGWTRVDGRPANATQLEVDKTVCRGEMDKANLSAGRRAVEYPEVFGYSEGMMSVYNGCMAQHGYMAAAKQ